MDEKLRWRGAAKIKLDTAAHAVHEALRGSGKTPDWPWASLGIGEKRAMYELVERVMT